MLRQTQRQHKGGKNASRECPDCHSRRFWKDRKRKTRYGLIQRYVCRDCDTRFSESSILSIQSYHSGDRQICVTLTEGTKNLTEVET